MSSRPISLNARLGREGASRNGNQFAAECAMLAGTDPQLIRSTFVTLAISSAREGKSLAAKARLTAAAYDLIAAVEVDGGRLRATFTRREGERTPLDDQA